MEILKVILGIEFFIIVQLILYFLIRTVINVNKK
jgi:hypothetical protein